MDNGGAVVTLKETVASGQSSVASEAEEVASGQSPVASQEREEAAGTSVRARGSALATGNWQLATASGSFGAVTGSDGTFEIGDVPVGQYFLIVNKEGYQAACMALVTMVVDGEEKKLGVMELASVSGLVRFADADGIELVPYKEEGTVRYYTNQTELKAMLNASGAVRMRMGWSEAEVDAEAFETYAVEKDVTVPSAGDDGPRTLFVDLRDQCGMERRYEAAVLLDREGPETAVAEAGGIEGLDGKKYVTDAGGVTTLRLSATDEVSGIAGYRYTIDEEPGEDVVWAAMPGSGSIVVSLGTEEKEYGVYVEYADRAGNTKAAAVATVTLDHTPPEVLDPAVTVQNGVDIGGKPTVTDDFVTFVFNVSGGAAQYGLGDVSGGGSWQDFSATASQSLAGRQRGDISQYVRFRDNAKNETQEYAIAYAYETQGSVKGKAVLEGGGDPTGISVLISATGASAVQPDANGDFAILGVEKGSYTVKYTAAGHDEAQQVVVVKAGAESVLSSIELKRARGSLKGVFTLAGAQSHGGISVKVAEAGLTVETAVDGSFELKNLVAQEYTLTASKYGYVSISGQVVTVPAGGEGVAAGGELQVSMSATIAGTAVCDVGNCGGATISANGARFDGTAASANATANTDGTFTISSLAGGSYTVTARKDGYGHASATIKVEPGESAAAGEILLKASRGSIRGTVTAGGTNAAGAQVTLSGTSAIGESVAVSALSGTDGTFRLDGILAGSYTLSASLKDYVLQTKNVDVTAGVETDAGTFALAINPGSISGKVVLEGGADPSGVQVIVVAQGVSPVVPDNTGAYTVQNLPAGSYTVRYTMAGYDEGQQMVVVEAGKTANVPDVSLKKSRGGLSGKFTLSGATSHGGVTVRIAEAGLSTETAADGTWGIGNLVAQQYTVNATKYGYTSATNIAATVPAGGAGNVAETQLQVDLTASISGTVVCDIGSCGSAGIALTGTRFDGQGVTQNGIANPDGTYTLGSLAAGEYSIDGTKAGYKAGQTHVTVEPGAAKNAGNIGLVAQRGGIDGTVQVGGVAQAGAQVTVVGTSTLGLTVNQTVTTGADGTFALVGVLAGTYTLTISLADHNPSSQQVTVAGDATTPVGTVTLTINPGTVTGTVALEGGGNPNGVTVTVDGGNATNPDGTGAYTIAGLKAGTHTVAASLSGYYPASTTVVVVAGQSVAAPNLTLMRARGKVIGLVELVGEANDEGALVAVTKGGQRWATTSDTTGAFEISGVPADSGYEVTASKEGFLSKKVTGVTVEADVPEDVGTFVLERMTGDFNFLHCQHWTSGDKQMVSVVGLSYVTACDAGGGPRVRLELSPPADTTKVSWSLSSGFDPEPGVAWNPADPPEAALGGGSGTIRVYVRYWIGTQSQWTGEYSAGVFVDREIPVLDEAVVVNDPAYLTPTKTYMDLSVKARDPMSGAEEGSGVDKYLLVAGGGACPADPSAYLDIPGDIETGTEISVQVVTNPGTEAEGVKTVKVCVLDAAGNLANPVDRTIVFDKTAPQILALADEFAFYLDRTDASSETLVGTRVVVLKAKVHTEYAPLSGVAFATQGFDCDTATYEMPDVLSDVPGGIPFGTLHDYVIAKDWVLSGSDGTKRAHVCLRDAAGNTTGSSTETEPDVQLDTAGPATCAIVLKSGAPATSATDIGITLSSSDPAGDVHVSGDVATDSPYPVNNWNTFVPNPAPLLRLSAGDGVKTVTIKCRDTVQNESGMSFATIVLDTVPPGGFITIDDGAEYTQDKDVKLTLAGIDDRTGVDKMKVSNDGTMPDCGNPGGYVPFTNVVNDWPLVDSEGTRAVTACFMDGAGNTAEIGSDSIFFDKNNPDGSITLNAGDDYVNTLQVMVGFSGVAADVVQMKLSNFAMTCGTETGYQSYSPVVMHTLLPGPDDPRTVYACLKDASGRVNAATISDAIGYDTTPPVVMSFALTGGEYTSATAATATLSASAAFKVRFTGDISAVAGGAVGEWMDVASPQGFTLTAGDGLKTVSAQFKDEAGNVTAAAMDSVTLDQTAPVATLSVNNGASETATAIVTLYVTASADVVEMATDDDDTGGLVDCAAAMYQPYTPVITYTLSAPVSGEETLVKVCVKDRAGLTGSATDGISFDNTAPVATSAELNNGAAYTQVTAVTLTSIVYSGAAEMYVDGDVEVAGGKTFEWITAAGSLGGLTLTTSNGLKMVRVRFRDAIGNVSSTVSDFITLDNVPPALGEVTIVDGDVTTSANLALTLFASEAAEMCVFGDVAYDADGPGGPNPPVSHDLDNVADCTTNGWWTSYTTALADGVVIAQNANAWNWVRVAYRDAAGNVSTPAVDSIYLDQTLPSVTVRTITGTVADGQTSTTLSGTQNVTLSWTVTNAGRVSGGTWDGAGTPTEMAFANVDCAAGGTNCTSLSYEPYASSKGWTLNVGTAPDGANRCVDYCFKDEAGNVSGSGRGQISLDLVAPSAPTLSIDGGEYATSTSVTGDLGVAGATQYYVEGDVTDAGSTFEWVTPGSFPVGNLALTLTSSQGNKVVMARYRDAAGNVSAAAIDSIELDTAPPTGTVVINSAAADTGSASVTLSFTASADTAYVNLSNDDAAPYCDLNCAAQAYTTPFSTTLVWNLSAVDGAKYVCACFRDAAGNTSAAAASDSIVLDTTAPVATSVTINNGDATTQSALVNLTSIVYSNATQMYVDGDVDISAGKTFEWITAAGSLDGVPLTNSNGLKTVMVRFKDSVGNVSSTVSDMITLDNQAPGTSQVTINEGEVANSANLALTLYASDAVQLCVYGDVAYDADGPGGPGAPVSHDSDDVADCTTNGWWVAYTTSLADGVVITQNANAWNYVRVAYKDGAGNVSAEVNDRVYLDQTAPSVTVRTVTGTVADGQQSTTLTGTQNVTLSWTVTNAGRVSGGSWDGAGTPTEMAFANVDCAAAATDCSLLSYEPYASSRSWTLAVGTAPDGANRCVDYCFKDQAGNYSASGRGQISLDLVAPSAPTLSIDQGEYATGTGITADLNASGAAQHYVEGDVTDTASTFEWVAAAFPRNDLGLTLSGADGTKVVMARFRDAAGNVSAAAIDTIQLDTVRPSGTVSVNGGAAKTTSQSVTLSLTASSDTAYVYLANDDSAPYCDATSIDCSTQTYTTPFSAAIAWNLSGGDSAKYVCACYRDRAGNTSAAAAWDSISLDTTPPVANSVEIALGATYTTSANVNLTTISATDAAQMYVDGDVEISAGKTFEWITYAGNLDGVPLTGSNGLKMVRVRFRDDVGNVSATVSDFITYDSQAPDMGSVTIAEGDVTNSANLALTLYASDAAQMCVFGDVAYDADGPGGAAPVSHDSDNVADCTTFNWWVGYTTSLADGYVIAQNANAWNYVRVAYRDAAGNVSTAVVDQVYLDTTSPSVTVRMITGTVADGQGSTTLTGTQNVTLSWTVTNAGQVMGGSWTAGAAPVEMAFQNVDCAAGATTCSSLSHEPYLSSKGWTLNVGTAPDGAARCVDYCFRDQAGNYSASGRGTINLDLVASTTPTLSIDQGEYAIVTGITADLNATGATQYYVEGDVANTPVTFEWVAPGAWPVSNLGLTLAGPDGTKVVMAKYRDAAGNVSTTALDTILLDTAPPSGTVTINSGATYTNSQLVTLNLSNVSSDVTNVDIKDASTVCTDAGRTYATPYSASIVYSLPAGEGSKTVYVCFMDRAGNKSSAQATDSITLDTVAPSNPTISINNGAEYTNSTSIVVDVGAGAYPVYYYIEGNVTDTANTFEWKSAAAAVDDLAVTLVAVEGAREVRVKLKDDAGNESYAAFDSIIYDATNPSTSVMSFSINDNAGYTNSRVVGLQIHGEDPVSGIVKYQISRSSTFGGTVHQCVVEPPSVCATDDTNCTFECAYDEYSEVFADYELEGTTSGNKYVYLRVQDGSGRWSASSWTTGKNRDYIYYDATAPSLTSIELRSNSGTVTESVNSGSVRVYFTGASDAQSGLDKSCINNDPPGLTTPDDCLYSTGTYAYFTLTPGDGLKTVRASVRDRAGSYSGTASDTVTLDTQAPVVLSFGAQRYVKSTTVAMTLEGDDNLSAVADLQKCVKVGAAVTCSSCSGGDWTAYSSSFAQALSLTINTDNKVNVCLKDQAGNVTANPTSAWVFYETTAPNLPQLGTLILGSRRITVNWTAVTDQNCPNCSGLSHYELQYDDNSGFSSPATIGDIQATTYNVAGLDNHRQYWFRVSAIDMADNQSGWSSPVKSSAPGWRNALLAPAYVSAPVLQYWDGWLVLRSSKSIMKCNAGANDCLDPDNWSEGLISSNNTHPSVFSMGPEWIYAPAIYYVGSGADKLYAYVCKHTEKSCLDSADWTLLTLDSSLYTVKDSIHITSSGERVIMGYVDGASDGDQDTPCVTYCHHATGCDEAADWQINCFAPDLANNNAFRVLQTDDWERYFLFFSDTSNYLRAKRCFTSTLCDAPADWTEHTVSSIAGAGNLGDVVYTTDRIYLAHAPETASDHELRIERCNLSSSCDATGDWTALTLVASDVAAGGVALAEHNKMLHLVYQQESSKKLTYGYCDSRSVDCTTAVSQWTLSDLDTMLGEDVGRPTIAFAGDNIFIAIKSSSSRIKLYSVPAPAPVDLTVGPGVDGIQATWSAMSFVDGYSFEYDTDSGEPYTNVFSIPAPDVGYYQVSTAQNDFYATLRSTKNGDNGDRATEFIVRPFKEGNVFALDLNANGNSPISLGMGPTWLLSLRLANNGWVYPAWCDWTTTDCTASGNWTSMWRDADLITSSDVAVSGDVFDIAYVYANGRMVFGTCDRGAVACTADGDWHDEYLTSGNPPATAMWTADGVNAVSVAMSGTWHVVLSIGDDLKYYISACRRDLDCEDPANWTKLTDLTPDPPGILGGFLFNAKVIHDSSNNRFYIVRGFGNGYVAYCTANNTATNPAVAANWTKTDIANAPSSPSLIATSASHVIQAGTNGRPRRYHSVGALMEGLFGWGGAYYQSCAYGCTDYNYWHTIRPFGEKFADDIMSYSIRKVDDTVFIAYRSTYDNKALRLMACERDCWRRDQWRLIDIDTDPNMLPNFGGNFFEIASSGAKKWQGFYAGVTKNGTEGQFRMWSGGKFKSNY
jgi:hypothetical protein